MSTLNDALGEILDKWKTGAIGSQDAIVEVFKLRQAISQPESEPVYSDIVSNGGLDPRNTAPVPAYVPLSDEQIDAVYVDSAGQPLRPQDYRIVLNFGRAIERAVRGEST